MDGYLDQDERSHGNKRNGKEHKKLKTGFGTFDIKTPQHGHSSFERSARPTSQSASMG